MTNKVKINVIGKIIEGDYKNWYVLVQEDIGSTKGYLVLISETPIFNSKEDSGEGFDYWVENKGSLEDFFEEAGWRVKWIKDDAVQEIRDVMNSQSIKINTVGKILEGENKGWFVLIEESSGGYLILTSSEPSFVFGKGYDDWVEKYEDLENFFKYSGWQIKWESNKRDRKKLKIPPEIEEKVLKNSLSLEEFGLKELAWIKEDALDLILELSSEKVGILGGGIYKIVTYYIVGAGSWECEYEPHETLEDYYKRSKTRTFDFIKNYPTPPEENVLFSLVFTNVDWIHKRLSKELGDELKALLDQSFDIIKIAKWAENASSNHAEELSLEFESVLQILSLMKQSKHDEYTEQELRLVAEMLINNEGNIFEQINAKRLKTPLDADPYT